MKAFYLLVAAAAGWFAPAAAQTTLAAGEVLVKVSATGTSSQVPDVITITVPIRSRGATTAEAKAANATAAARLKAALDGLGAKRNDITLSPVAQPFAFIGNEAIGVEPADVLDGIQSAAFVGYEIRLADRALLPKVEAALDTLGLDHPPPTGSLADDRAARAAAIVDAVRQARREADVYAGALDLRITRMVTVGNGCALDAGAGWMIWGGKLQNALKENSAEKVVTVAQACIEAVAAK